MNYVEERADARMRDYGFSMPTAQCPVAWVLSRHQLCLSFAIMPCNCVGPAICS